MLVVYKVTQVGRLKKRGGTNTKTAAPPASGPLTALPLTAAGGGGGPAVFTLFPKNDPKIDFVCRMHARMYPGYKHAQVYCYLYCRPHAHVG